MGSFKLVLKYVFVGANVLAVILLILSAYSDYISPNTSMLFAYLGMMFPVICVVNLCFLIWWLLLTEMRFLLVSLAAFAICWVPLKDYFPFHEHKEQVPDQDVIKVLTYNVMAFGYEDHTESNPNKIIQYIAESGADIVCMQEYVVYHNHKKLNSAKLYDALSMYPYHSAVFFDKSRYQDYGIAVFSKYPITDVRKVDYESKYNGSSVQTITVKGKKITLINNHLESFKLTSEDRNLYLSLIKGETNERFDKLTASLQQKLGPAFRMRATQAEAVAREIRDNSNEYILVCGDFNDTPISYAHHTIQGNLIDSFSESGKGIGTTYNRNFFFFRIDNILHSRNMKSFNCSIDKFRYSDHYPLWCYLQLN